MSKALKFVFRPQKADIEKLAGKTLANVVTERNERGYGFYGYLSLYDLSKDNAHGPAIPQDYIRFEKCLDDSDKVFLIVEPLTEQIIRFPGIRGGITTISGYSRQAVLDSFMRYLYLQLQYAYSKEEAEEHLLIVAVTLLGEEALSKPHSKFEFYPAIAWVELQNNKPANKQGVIDKVIGTLQKDFADIALV